MILFHVQSVSTDIYPHKHVLSDILNEISCALNMNSREVNLGLELLNRPVQLWLANMPDWLRHVFQRTVADLCNIIS